VLTAILERKRIASVFPQFNRRGKASQENNISKLSVIFDGSFFFFIPKVFQTGMLEGKT